MDIVGRRRQENALAGLTLTAVLTNETNPKHHQTRTLFDIIQEDKGSKSKKPWKSFKQKIRLRRAGSAWKSTVPIPASDVMVEQSGSLTTTRTHSNRFAKVPNVEDSDSNSDSDSESKEPAGGGLSNSKSMMLRGNSIRVPQRQPARMMVRETVTDDEPANEDDEEFPEMEEEEAKESDEDEIEEDDEMAAMVARPKEPRVKMSLMSLLAETDKEMGLDEDYTEGGGEEEEEEEDDDGGGGGYSNCCVCMVRHKGTPFVPCGHTFCRLCSKELYVQRGSCPLCTNYILEILDIF